MNRQLKADTPPAYEGNEGLWVVSNMGHASQWTAWTEWLARECGRTFLPEQITVPFEWPPSTQTGVTAYVDKVAGFRKAINWAKPIKHGIRPWRGPTLDELRKASADA